jgi:hypothetical protein
MIDDPKGNVIELVPEKPMRLVGRRGKIRGETRLGDHAGQGYNTYNLRQ